MAKHTPPRSPPRTPPREPAPVDIGSESVAGEEDPGASVEPPGGTREGRRRGRHRLAHPNRTRRAASRP